MTKEIIITVNNQADPAPELIEAAKILYNLHHSTLIWKEHYGCDNRKVMQGWQDKADAWLKEHVFITFK